jgi:tyrosinase
MKEPAMARYKTTPEPKPEPQPAQVRVRRDVWKLDVWDPILVWYADAILEMQQRPLNNPTSWRYQAAIHDYTRSRDPLQQPDDQLPSPEEQRRFWSQCQHGSWFFLPWHRIYLAYFEQIIAGIVAAKGGPDDWALPYWNYSDASNPNARKLPPAFREPNLPDGRQNPLRIAARTAASNQDVLMSQPWQVDLTGCLPQPFFTPPDPSRNETDPSFGGPRTQFMHGGGTIGELENVPHGTMHVAVGGFDPPGWMSRFNTAGLDPIFWLHHCNIDRLWSVWIERDPAHADPTESGWLTDIDFYFHDASGAVVTHAAGAVVDTETTPPFGYRYEDISDPLAPPVEPEERERSAAMGEESVPEMVGATEKPVTLTGEPVTAEVAVTAPTGPAATERAGAAAPERMVINFENVTSEGVPPSYLVYLNVPEGERPEDHPELRAGVLSMFGVVEASEESDDHPGSGLNYAINVGDLARRLGAPGENLRVTFVPAGTGEVTTEEVERGAAPETPPVQVGRISVYVG